MRFLFFDNLIRLTVCLLMGVFASSSIGQIQQPKLIAALEIEGPREAAPGELIRLSANTNGDETPFWIVLDPITLDYEQVDQGKRLIFSAPCQTNQTITVMLLAQQVRDGQIVTRQLRRSVLVGNPLPSPAPDPTPHPQPAEPPGSELKESALYGAVLQAWPLVSTDAGKTLSPKVAENLEQVAAMCASGKFSQAHEVWQLLSEHNRVDLQLETVAWEPVGQAIQKQFKLLALGSIKDHVFHLRAAAAAIIDAYASEQKNQNRKAIRR